MQRIQSVAACEERLRGAMIAGDVPLLSSLIDDELVFTDPTGNVLKKKDDLAAHRSRVLQIQRLDLFETHIHPITEAVIVTTKAQLSAIFDNQPISGVFAYTRVWREGDHGWRVIAGHCSRIGDL